MQDQLIVAVKESTNGFRKARSEKNLHIQKAFGIGYSRDTYSSGKLGFNRYTNY